MKTSLELCSAQTGKCIRAAIALAKAVLSSTPRFLDLSNGGVDDFTGVRLGGVAFVQPIGKVLKDLAADALHWSSFGYLDNREPNSTIPTPIALREASGIAMIANGGIADGPQAETTLTGGAADIVAIGRPIFAQPHWPYIVRSGVPYPWADFDRNTSFDRRWIASSHIRWRSMIRNGRRVGEHGRRACQPDCRPAERAEIVNEGARS